MRVALAAIVVACAWSDGRAAVQNGPSGAEASIEARAHAALHAGDYATSVRLFQLALSRLTADATTVSRGRLLEGLGESFRLYGRWQESAAAFTGALTACESAPATPTWCARVLQRLAAVHLQLEKGGEAKSELQRALALLASADGPMAARGEVFETLGDAAYFDRDYGHAEEHYSRAAEEAGDEPGAARLVLASALRSRASARTRLGRPVDASADAARALTIAATELPGGHPELEPYLNEAANTAWYLGDYATARRRWEEALSVVERHFGRDHSRAATMFNNLATLANHLGDHESAIRLQRRVVTIVRRDYGGAHQFVGQAYTRLGSIQFEAGDRPAARASFIRALAILERAGATINRHVAIVHIYLARLALATRALTETRTHVAAAETALGSTASSDTSRLALQAVKGELAWLVGELDAAERDLNGAADVYAASYNGHPEVAHARQQLADIALARGSTVDAARLAAEAEGLARSHLRLAMRDLSERLALSYDATRPPALDVLVSAAVASGDAEPAGTALTELARSRGQVFDELVERRRPRGDASAAETRLRDAYQAARSRWANIALRGPSGARDARYENALAAAREAVDGAERALAEESAEFRRTRERKEASVDDIRSALPEGTALVSFVRYGRRIPLPLRAAGAPPAAPPAPVPSYVAIVTSRTSPPVLVDLGGAASLDRLVATWRDEAARGITKAGRTPRQAERAYRRAGAALRARIWDPLAPHLTGATRILVVPDGALQAVTFAPLPVGTDRYLADSELAFHYLTTERDVMRPAATEHAEPSLLAVGGVDFGGIRAAAGSASVAAPASGATRAAQAADLLRLPINADGCLSFDEIEFPALPATAQEAREIEQMWRATGGTALRLSGGQARERRIRELAPRQRMLHFATHGFFLDSTCARSAAGTRSVRKRVRPGDATPAPRPPVQSSPQLTPARRPVNPLALSGLAFANANSHAQTTRGEDDGVLTAEEVAALDLQGVEWVVLSACDTGLGPIRAREGVLGLRRAFEVAGARTVIMSLWSVEDRTTRLWMRELYRSRLQGRRDTIDSMREANRVMLEARRATGATTHPYYWAGFVATGDWR